MNIQVLQSDSFGRELSLSAGDNRTVDVRQPISVHCASGMLWVTVEGDSRDFFLRAGQTMNLVMHGKAIIGAERNSTITVELAGARANADWTVDPLPLPNPVIFNQPALSGA
ncbi:DUF2917 domain-containing protein [Noviherbaspirillum denitrificans]|uniref:DUF2917 domain-containing protein n=1 Tax=Noviherbaspirillum denitrificans TaxID=1968433 RepID=A0A254TFZ6_9BURK|nr:DUF2917 domain-containing protein [Noviherbaspirillum denitrificans]OWW21579.1 hypothetical protein AYR66_20910 [Noviherbaspirillum denitrificans]